jgi:hypothetical protein
MAMNGVPISEARRLGKAAKATRVAIVAVDEDGSFSVTTWGETKRLCDTMRNWSGTHGDAVAMEIFEQG